MTTLLPHVPTFRERLIPVGVAAWRVLAPSGRAIGHISVDEAPDQRFHARRFHVPTAAFVEVGSFWTLDDAIGSLRGG